MFNFLVRRLPRFSFLTLLAAMLLVISVGGAVGTGFGPDYEVAAALTVLEQEGFGYSAGRPSGDDVNATTLSADAWNPFGRMGKWLVGYSDPVTAIEVYGWPSPATRETLFALPHAVEIGMHPAPVRLRTEGPERMPSPEEILGRPLPDLPDVVALPPEPPPVPRGVALAGEERDEALREIRRSRESISRSDKALPYLCVEHSTDYPATTMVTASDAQSCWNLRYDHFKKLATAKTELWTPDCGVSRRWEADGWRTFNAIRAPGKLSHHVRSSIGISWPRNNFQAWGFSYAFPDEPGDSEDLYESVERLADGTLAFRLRPRELRPAEGRLNSFELIGGSVVLDPRHDFVVRRMQIAAEGLTGPGSKCDFCYLSEYEEIDGQFVIVRCSSWTDMPATTLDGVAFPAGPRTGQARYAWEFDPVIPKSLFDPPRGKGEFFTSSPPRGLHWWYVTGALSLGWLYFAATNGIRRRFRQKRAMRTPMAPPSNERTNAIAESGSAS